MMVALAAIVIVFVASGPSGAQKQLNERIRKVYALDKRNGDCRLCHIYEPGEYPRLLNPYGIDLAANALMKPLLRRGENATFTPEELDLVEKVAKSLEYEDSDGDGAYNLEEFDIGTLPGDPTSVPSAKDLAAYRKEHPLPKEIIAALVAYSAKKSETKPILPAAIAPIHHPSASGTSFPIEYPVAGALILVFAIIGYTKWKAAR